MPYAKIWTDIRNDSWFISLSCTERGVWLQMIVHAKAEGDTGVIVGRSWSALGSLWGCDGKTCRKILGKFLVATRIKIFDENGCIMIQIINYTQWQQLTEKNKHGKFPQMGENSRKIPPITRADKSRQYNGDFANGDLSETNKVPFEEFWNLYDKKRGDREKLRKKWDSFGFEIQQKIMAYIPAYKNSQPDKQFRKDPRTFLNNKSWEDEILEKNHNGTKEQVQHFRVIPGVAGAKPRG